MTRKTKKEKIAKVTEKLQKEKVLEEFKEWAKLIIEKLNKIINYFEEVLIITHDNPDPDAVSTCLAVLRYLHKEKPQMKIEIRAKKESISPETTTIINSLGIEIKPLTRIRNKKNRAIVLLDVESTNQSNLKIPNIQPDLIIDHHSPNSPFTSTAAIITLLMTTLEVEIQEDLSTALFVGIEIDTHGFTSDKFTDFDALAFKILSPLINIKLRKKIVKCGYSEGYRLMLKEAFSKDFYQRAGSTVVSGVGFIKPNQQTGAAKVADFLLEEKGVESVVVIAFVEDEKSDSEGNITSQEIYVLPTTRSSTATQSAEELNKKVFGNLTGGSSTMASGRIPLLKKTIKEIKDARKFNNEQLLRGIFIQRLNEYKDKVLTSQSE